MTISTMWNTPQQHRCPSWARFTICHIVAALSLTAILPGANPIVIPDRVVRTSSGQLIGKVITIESDTNEKLIVDAFLGLDYASLFGGEYRFMPPATPQERWKGIRYARTPGPACPQREGDSKEKRLLRRQSEECLNLNLYSPRKVIDDDKKSPVIFVVHGGNRLETGSGNLVDGSSLAALGDVIVVTLNYRLGPLGFLPTSQFGRVDNAGLFDILAALDWVQRNVADFGGDKERVTLFGVGYGAVLANTLLLSPFTKDNKLFSRCILQTNREFGDWSITAPTPATFLNSLVTDMNCTRPATSSSEADLLDCLMTLSADELIAVVNTAAVKKRHTPLSLSYGPVYDNKIAAFPSNRYYVERQYERSAFVHTPLLIGFTEPRALAREAYTTLSPQESAPPAHVAEEVVEAAVNALFTQNQNVIEEILLYEYGLCSKSDEDSNDDDGGEDNNNDGAQGSKRDVEASRAETLSNHEDNVLELLGDALVRAPVMRTALEHSKYEDTFVFRMDEQLHRGPEGLGMFEEPTQEGDNSEASTWRTREAGTHQALIKFWSNFAKTGNPSFPTTGIDAVAGDEHLLWPKYTTKIMNQEIMYFQHDAPPKLIQHYGKDKLQLWNNLLPRVQAADDPMTTRNTLPPPTPPPPPPPPPQPDVLATEPLQTLDVGKPDIPDQDNDKDEGGDVKVNHREESNTGESESSFPFLVQVSIGVGVGILLIVIIVLVCVCCCCKKRKSETQKSNGSANTETISTGFSASAKDDAQAIAAGISESSDRKLCLSTCTAEFSQSGSTAADDAIHGEGSSSIDLHTDSQLELAELYKSSERGSQYDRHQQQPSDRQYQHQQQHHRQSHQQELDQEQKQPLMSSSHREAESKTMPHSDRRKSSTENNSCPPSIRGYSADDPLLREVVRSNTSTITRHNGSLPKGDNSHHSRAYPPGSPYTGGSLKPNTICAEKHQYYFDSTPGLRESPYDVPRNSIEIVRRRDATNGRRPSEQEGGASSVLSGSSHVRATGDRRELANHSSSRSVAANGSMGKGHRPPPLPPSQSYSDRLTNRDISANGKTYGQIDMLSPRRPGDGVSSRFFGGMSPRLPGDHCHHCPGYASDRSSDGGQGSSRRPTPRTRKSMEQQDSMSTDSGVKNMSVRGDSVDAGVI